MGIKQFLRREHGEYKYNRLELSVRLMTRRIKSRKRTSIVASSRNDLVPLRRKSCGEKDRFSRSSARGCLEDHNLSSGVGGVVQKRRQMSCTLDASCFTAWQRTRMVLFWNLDLLNSEDKQKLYRHQFLHYHTTAE